jgi:hypothetical protein
MTSGPVPDIHALSLSITYKALVAIRFPEQMAGFLRPGSAQHSFQIGWNVGRFGTPGWGNPISGKLPFPMTVGRDSFAPQFRS